MKDFLFGVFTSLLATAIWVIAVYIRRTLAIRDLRGVWMEVRHRGCQNPNYVCFLELSYPIFEKGYRIEGVVFTDEWRRDARWVTMSCSFEENLKRIYYSYSGTQADSLFTTSHGYGLITLGRHGKELLMDEGYFLDAKHAATPAACEYLHVTAELPSIKAIGDIDVAAENPDSPLRKFVSRSFARRKD